MKESQVYMAQQPPPIYREGKALHKDLSSAQRYGTIRVLLESDDQPSLLPGPSIRQIRSLLKSFDPAKDYLCYAGGDAMALALAMVVLRDMGFREVSILRYERERDTEGRRTRGGYYVPVKVPLIQ